MIDTEAAKKLVGGDQIRHIKSGRIYTVCPKHMIGAGTLKGSVLIRFCADGFEYARFLDEFLGFEIVQKVAE